MRKRITALSCVAALLLPLLTQAVPQASAAGTAGVWKLVDTTDYLNETVEYSDGAALIYTSGANNVSYTYRNNAGQNFSGTCTWSDPASAIQAGETFSITLGASIDELDPKRVGTFSAEVNAYIDNADISYKLKSGSAVDLKSADGSKTCKALGKDGQIVTGSASLTVSGSLPEKQAGARIAVMISTNIGGGKKYVYEYSVPEATPAPTSVPAPTAAVSTTPTAEPSPTPTEPEKRPSRLEIAVKVFSVDNKAMSNLYVKFKPSYQEKFAMTTNDNGTAWHSFNIPEEAGSTFTVDVTLMFSYFSASFGSYKECFRMIDQTQTPDETMWVTTTIKVDLDSPAFKGEDTVRISRDLRISNLASGYLSASGSGERDEMSSNLADPKPMMGYSFLYNQLCKAIFTGDYAFDEWDNMADHFPLFIYVNDSEKSAFHSDGGYIVINSSDSKFNDWSRFTILHEFGHFFDYATNGGALRCGEAEKRKNADYLNHGGYLNSDTGDSYVEGFATFFAVMVNRYGGSWLSGDAILTIPTYGSLKILRKPWKRTTSEELCIASVLTYMDKAMGLNALWEVIKPDRDNLYAYYQALLESDYAKGSTAHTAYLKKVFYKFNLYKQLKGNGAYNAGEMFRDKNGNNAWDERELYADLMFDVGGRWLEGITTEEVMETVGQSSDALRDRDAPAAAVSVSPDSSGTLYHMPNSYLKVTGLTLPEGVRIGVAEDGQEPYAYTTAPEGDLIYLPVPEDAATGTIEVTIPGGGTLWTGDIGQLQEQYALTEGQSTWLAEAELTADMLPEEEVICCAVYGDYYASPVLDPDAAAETSDQAQTDGAEADLLLELPEISEPESGFYLASSSEKEDAAAPENDGASMVIPGVLLIAAGAAVFLVLRKKQKK
jgi:hypothetical protein